ncbi:MAG: hypothetical protein AB7G87_05230 [Clostridia bacterium]
MIHNYGVKYKECNAMYRNLALVVSVVIGCHPERSEGSYVSKRKDSSLRSE